MSCSQYFSLQKTPSFFVFIIFVVIIIIIIISSVNTVLLPAMPLLSRYQFIGQYSVCPNKILIVFLSPISHMPKSTCNEVTDLSFGILSNSFFISYHPFIRYYVV